MPENLPDIYLFNPTCEYAVANGHASWQPNRLLQKMEEDLGTLPLFLARPHDVVLVKNLPPASFISRLKQMGISVPHFVPFKEISPGNSFAGKPKGCLLPWGWSPATHRLLEPLKPSCSAAFKNSPVAKWQPGYREIYSKKFGLQILKSVLPQLPPEKVLPKHLLPEICSTKVQMETLLRGWGKLMVKAPWSSSGRGLQPITKSPIVPKVWEKIIGIINEQGYAITEPLLDKVLDQALQFELKKGKATYLGESRFLTDSKGQYQGNFLSSWPEKIPPEAKALAQSLPQLLAGPLTEAIESSPLSTYYEGFFGIDTLLFLDVEGVMRVNPCLEINVRQNMGLLSLHLEKLLVHGKKGIFKTFYQPGKSFLEFQKEMKTMYPARLKFNQIESGFFPLTPAGENTLFGAYILVKK
jgi:hypothetical protein